MLWRGSVAATLMRLQWALLLLVVEGVFGRVLLLENFIDFRFAAHGPLDGELGGLVVVLVNLFFAFRFPVDENAADDNEIFGLVLGNDACGDTVGYGLGYRLLRRPEHLDRLS